MAEFSKHFFADAAPRTVEQSAIIWSAIVLLVLGPVGIVAWARTRRRTKELETIAKLAEQGFSAEEIARAIEASKEPLHANRQAKRNESPSLTDETATEAEPSQVIAS